VANPLGATTFSDLGEADPAGEALAA